MKIIIKITYRMQEFYIGCGAYWVNREKYAVLTNESQAKRYKSLKTAKNAYEKLYESCCNLEGDVEFMEVAE